ncbi:MAG: aminotransferase class III-fold pyridoxal phosphate-dependent enzyme, partial [Litorimonas sp.]
PLAMAAGIAVWDRISEAGFLQHVRDVSNAFRQSLEGLKDEFPDLIEEVRGKGLLIGLKMKVPGDQLEAKRRLLDHKLMVGTAGDNVLRMAPPLIIAETEMREAMETLRTVMREMKTA